MPIIGLNTFRGLFPKIDPRRLGQEDAQVAENTNLIPRNLTPFLEPATTQALTDALQETIFLWRRNDTTEWLSWALDIDVIKGPIYEDQYDRIYYSGNGDIRIKGWDGGVSDRVASLPSPDAPTVSSKSWIFDASVVTATYKDTSGTYQLSLSGYERNEGVLKFIFHLASHIAGEAPWQYRLTIPDTGDDPASASTPTNLTDDPSDIYEDKIDLLLDGTKYATFQVTQIDYTNYQWDADVGNGYTIPFDIEFTVNMNYERATNQFVYYVETFVDDWGMEGPPSRIDQATAQNPAPVTRITSSPTDLYQKSEATEWQPGEVLNLALGGDTPGGYFLSKRRIYRSAAGTSEDAFFFLAEVDEDQTTYADSKSDAELAEPMPLVQNPPDGLQGLIGMPGGFTAAFKGKELYMSPLYLPHSYPDQYRLTFEFDVVAIAASGNDIIVMTTGSPYYVTGSHPEVMTQTKLMVNQACVAKKGVAAIGNLILYPSPDGIVAVENGSARLISEPYFDRTSWQALAPSSMIGASHDKKLFAFFTDDALVWDFDEGPRSLVKTTQRVTGLYDDLEDDILYMIQSAEITSWEGGTDYLTAKWRSKEFQLKKPLEFNSGRVEADSYDNCVLRVYSKGVADVTAQLIITVNVIDGLAFRLTKARPERVWTIEVENDSPVTEIAIATSMELLR